MNIKGISENIQIERLTASDSAKMGRLRKNTKTGGGRTSDEADTSLLSQLMAKSARELRTIREPRQASVEAAEATMDKPIKVTPQVTNTIFKRMISG